MTAPGGMTITSKVFADNGKMRSEVTANGMQMISIIRPDLQKSYSVMVAQKMIMEMPYDPAKAKQMMSTQPEGKTEVVGPDTVDGIACTKYKVTTPENKVVFMWTDAAKKIPVKMAAEDNTFTILWKNFKAGPQPASLFELPTGYQKMEMPSMPGMPGGGAPPPPPASGQ